MATLKERLAARAASEAQQMPTANKLPTSTVEDSLRFKPEKFVQAEETQEDKRKRLAEEMKKRLAADLAKDEDEIDSVAASLSEARPIDLVKEQFASAYVPESAIEKKRKELEEAKKIADAKAHEANAAKIAQAVAKAKELAASPKVDKQSVVTQIKAVQSLADKIAAKRQKEKEDAHAQTEGSSQATVQSQAPQVQQGEAETPKASNATTASTPVQEAHQPTKAVADSNTSNTEGTPVSPVVQRTVSPDAKQVIGSFIASEGRKMSLAERLALKKASQEAAKLAVEPPEVLSGKEFVEDPNAVTADVAEEYKGAFSLNISLNAKQLAAKEMALAGKNFCLIGAAGTGKTTTQRSVAESLLQDKRLKTTSFKLVGGGGKRIDAPSIAFCAYTKRATANLQRAIHKNPELEAALQHNVMTIHGLLEFEPVTFYDEEKNKESMRFEPMKTRHNPLSITHLVIEEASMLGLDLWEMLYDALPLGVQIIFIGDINQLPPVFGSSILNYALVQLPIVELTEVYRQQGDSLVLANAHHILKGESLEEGKGFTIVRGKSAVQVGQEKMAQTLGAMFKEYYKVGFYDPETDIILSPFNKQPLGTDNMNKWIAQFLGEKREAVVFEVLAGFNTQYLAIGDKVMYNKQDAIIKDIKRNGLYHGKEPQMPGPDLSRFGVRIIGHNGDSPDLDDLLLGYSEFSIEELAEQDTERKQQASHIVTLETETGQIIHLDSAGDFSPQIFSLGYVLTVHKAQGCEWKKVFLIFHKDHSVMLFRELFYTGVTRAREDVVLIAKDHILEKAIKTQRIKGNSLADKIEYFNSGAIDVGMVECTK